MPQASAETCGVFSQTLCRMGRPRKPLDLSAPFTRISVDLPTDLVAQADALAAELNTEFLRTSGCETQATRSTALGCLLRLGLQARERRDELTIRAAELERQQQCLDHAEKRSNGLREEQADRVQRLAYRKEMEHRGREAASDYVCLTRLGFEMLGALLTEGPMTSAQLGGRLRRSRRGINRVGDDLRIAKLAQLVRSKTGDYRPWRWEPTTWARVLGGRGRRR